MIERNRHTLDAGLSTKTGIASTAASLKGMFFESDMPNALHAYCCFFGASRCFACCSAVHGGTTPFILA